MGHGFAGARCARMSIPRAMQRTQAFRSLGKFTRMDAPVC